MKGRKKTRMTLDKFFLDKEDTVLLIVDVQEKLAAVMTEKDKVVRNNLHLIELAKMIKMPIMVTEQYSKGLGPTVAEIRTALPFYRPVEKMTFDCCGQPPFLEELKEHNTRNVVLTGMETHICVLQTCIGLLKGGINVHIVQDAVCSRTRENWKIGVEFMREAGAVVTSAETVLFQLLKVAGTEEFKKISQRIK
jgi:nicotinamidase-related amidase